MRHIKRFSLYDNKYRKDAEMFDTFMLKPKVFDVRLIEYIDN